MRVGILPTGGEHLHMTGIISLRGEVWAHKAGINYVMNFLSY